jgi:heme oxygenase
VPTTPRGWLPRLRAATEPLHADLDEEAFVDALRRGEASDRELVTFLWIMALLHAATARACAAQDDPALRDLAADVGARGLEAESDLTKLAADACVDVTAMRPVTAVAETILWRAHEDPSALAGAVYVLQGSRRGARVLAEPLAEQHPELRFFAAGAEGFGPQWRRLCAALEARDPAAADGACELAAAIFRALIDALRALMSPPNPSRATAMVLNTEAGAHPIVTAPRSLVAALVAGIRCWRDFPYLEARYGTRGRRFTGSDSAWLATLAGAAHDAALKKIRWLGRVLAARGLPTLILEAHITCLHRELAAFAAVDAADLTPLIAAAEALRSERTQHLDDAARERLEAEFSAALRKPDPFATPTLIAAAVADERSGHELAVESVASWLADDARFGRRWSRAVDDLVASARELAR